ncbi:NACHT, LRR and PYD domains-containing protein 1b allele 2-like [Colossoma macropomum]|uniref:NACHT, LRR and PYD domains-containing protein 1b allele 2-like n=1 Tax=Colossoma macropomum TaxID=42526 RepID=UPI001863ABE1|nr:NACHT, LRR and PYD domains-containing protein 1b allele 2-like [Colossoma macropomum]
MAAERNNTQSGSALTLSCHLSPEISAVSMEIRWFKGTDCVCLYKNRQVTEGRGYEGRVSLFTQELQRGNVSLQIRDCRDSDSGDYLCQVTNGDTTEEYTVGVTRDIEWTEEERLKMKESVLLIEKSLSRVSVSSGDSLAEGSSSASAQTSYDEHFSMAAAEGFSPEMHHNLYRFLCPHAGQFQCSETHLVFEMEGKGEVLYKIEPWDPHFLDGLGQMQPAGPLYSIDCFEGSLSHLLLPHCEIQYDCNFFFQVVVAHFTGDNTEIIQPLNVTNTHVIINIQGLSLFGLLKKMILHPSPINAQVLLFYKEIMDKQRRKQLNIHLLPGNVPDKEVKDKHEDVMYFKTSSTCKLIPGRRYRPLCDPYVSEPKVAIFERDYGPNYHPTFVVFLQAEEATLSLLDKDDMEVWEPHQILLATEKPGYSTETSPLRMEAGAAFVDEHRAQLIQRVSSVMEMVDCLHSKNMITAEMYSNIQNATPSQKQMRILYRVLDSGGKSVKAEFYKVLKVKQPFLVDELEVL